MFISKSEFQKSWNIPKKQYATETFCLHDTMTTTIHELKLIKVKMNKNPKVHKTTGGLVFASSFMFCKNNATFFQAKLITYFCVVLISMCAKD